MSKKPLMRMNERPANLINPPRTLKSSLFNVTIKKKPMSTIALFINI
jgi:hypothetical protein